MTEPERILVVDAPARLTAQRDACHTEEERRGISVALPGPCKVSYSTALSGLVIHPSGRLADKAHSQHLLPKRRRG